MFYKNIAYLPIALVLVACSTLKGHEVQPALMIDFHSEDKLFIKEKMKESFGFSTLTFGAKAFTKNPTVIIERAQHASIVKQGDVVKLSLFIDKQSCYIQPASSEQRWFLKYSQCRAID